MISRGSREEIGSTSIAKAQKGSREGRLASLPSVVSDHMFGVTVGISGSSPITRFVPVLPRVIGGILIHTSMFSVTDGPKQDYLWRFDLPSEERVRVLRLLNDYNLNAFSLFDSEETLLETMWFREQVLRKSSS